MIHTTYNTLIEKSGQWLGLNGFLAKLEKAVGARDAYGLDTPIALTEVLKAVGVVETIDVLSKVTDGETPKAIDLCRKIVRVATHRACNLIGRQDAQFDWYADFAEEGGKRLAAFWATDACDCLKALKDHEEKGGEAPVSFYTTLAHNAVSLMLKAAMALQEPAFSQRAADEELTTIYYHMVTSLDPEVTPPAEASSPSTGAEPSVPVPSPQA